MMDWFRKLFCGFLWRQHKNLRRLARLVVPPVFSAANRRYEKGRNISA
ncbi:hypothetical protein [Neisseria dentiae]